MTKEVLRRACLDKDPQVLMKCLENGISLDSRTLLHLICIPEDRWLVRRNTDGKARVYKVKRYYYPKRVTACLDLLFMFSQPDVNLCNANGETPLTLAMTAVSPVVMRSLLIQGAHIEPIQDLSVYDQKVQQYVRRIRTLSLFLHEEKLPLMLIQYGLAPFI